MSTDLGQIALELLGLPAKSRAMLAHKLIESLEEEDSPDTTNLWIEAAKRRAKELDGGTEPGIPAEEVFRQMEEELG
ncbi:MAG: addiction module protein [Thermoguttaceae bacterium]